MTRFLGAAAVLLATALGGCGDQDAGAVGTWTIDMEPMIAQQRGPLLETLKTQMKAIQEQLKGLSGADQAKARDMALEAVPAELKDLTTAMLTSEAAGIQAVNKMLAEKLGGLEATLEIKSGGAFTSAFAMGASTQRIEGTWTLQGDKLTLTATKKDGKPPEGKDKEPLVLTLKDGRLNPATDGPPFSFKRK